MEENIGSKIVSMRCLRHKKRFNVPKEWLETSKWLCPHCFESLSEESRQKYAPKNGTIPEVREAEVGKPMKYPSFWMFGGIEQRETETDSGKTKEEEDSKIVEILEEPPLSTEQAKESKSQLVAEDSSAKSLLDEPKLVNSEETVEMGNSSTRGKPKRVHKPEGYRKGSYVPPSTLTANPRFVGLLPRFTIFCQKCGQVVKCHYSWFNQSTVLCPECFSHMGNYERMQFHKTHNAPKPEYTESSIPLSVVRTPCNYDANRIEELNRGMLDYHLVDGEWSSSYIRRLTVGQLQLGVKSGHITKARLRAELRRRRDPEYYDACHSADKVVTKAFFR